jgi:transcriptional regulator with XRE-family HTH domain
MTLGEKITRRLGELNKSQNDLATFIHKAQSRISKWVQGTGHPSPEDLLNMARFLGVPVEYLCDPRVDDPDEIAGVQTPKLAQGLPPEEQLCWEAIRRLGPDESLRRLLGAPLVPPPAQPASAPQELPPVGQPIRMPGRRMPEASARNHAGKDKGGRH